MKKRILKTIKILTAYIMLNIGLLSWIEVSSVSGNKLSSAQTAMAEIRTDNKNGIEISVLGRCAFFDFSFMESKDLQTVFLAGADPLLTAVLSEIAYCVYNF